MHFYQEDERSKEPKSSFYDARRAKDLEVLEVDIAEFRKAVDDREDKIVKSKDTMGVLLTNGSKLPDPEYNDTKDREKGSPWLPIMPYT